MHYNIFGLLMSQLGHLLPCRSLAGAAAIPRRFNGSAQHLLILPGEEVFDVTSRIWFTAAQKAELWSDGRTGKVLRPSRGRWKEEQDRR